MVVLDAPKIERSRLRQEARQRLAAYTAGLQAVVRQVVNLVHPLRVILFGSQARGDARPESDWDLMVVMPVGAARNRTALKLYGSVRRNGLPCEFFVSTPGDFERYAYHPSLVYKHVLEEGVDMYVDED